MYSISAPKYKKREFSMYRVTSLFIW